MLSEDLVDIATRHQVYLERLKTGEIRKTDAMFVSIGAEIIRILNRLNVENLSLLGIAARAKLIDDVRRGHVDAYTKELTRLSNSLRGLADFEREFEIESINEALTDEVEAVPAEEEDEAVGLWASIQERAMSATGATLAGWLGAWMAHEVTRSTDMVRKGIQEGWTVSQLMAAFRGTSKQSYTDGLIASARRNTATTINTAVQHVAASARVHTMQGATIQPKGGGRLKTNKEGAVTSIPRNMRAAAQRAGIKVGTKVNLMGYRWVSILDSKTSQICRSLDGQVFAFGEGPLPPAHPNCRSTIIAEIRGRWVKRAPTGRFAKRDERTSASGPVDGGVTYYEWLKTQAPEFQDDALGVTRAALFRKGGLSAAAFARLNLGRNFQPLTLEQMRRLKPNAFKRAGV